MAIFVNYRRDDTQSIVGRIDDHLRAPSAFGVDGVYRDIDNIPIGVDFVDHLSHALARCDIVLAIIGRAWVSPRLADPNDFVRQELETALARGLVVIPVLVEGAKLPTPDQVPASLHPLLRVKAAEVDPLDDFRTDMQRLIEAINRARSARSSLPGPSVLDAAARSADEPHQFGSAVRASRLKLAAVAAVVVVGGGVASLGAVQYAGCGQVGGQGGAAGASASGGAASAAGGTSAVAASGSSALSDGGTAGVGAKVREAWQYLDGAPACSPKDSGSYVPGVLALLCKTRDRLTIGWLEQLSGERVFLSGPHVNQRLNLNSARFGHYNPRFVDWALEQLVPGANDRDFQRLTQASYDRHLKLIARAYHHAQLLLEVNPELYDKLVRSYSSALQRGEVDPGKVLLDAARSAYGQADPIDPYLSPTAVGFWVRRKIDGTSSKFARGLVKLLKAYDPNALATLRAKRLPPDERDDPPRRSSVRFGTPTVQGRLASAAIERIVRAQASRFRLCHEQGLRRTPALSGRVAMRFVITSAGQVSSASPAGSDLPDAGVVTCVSAAFRGLTFPKPSAGVVTVSYPLVFSNE
jgi:hypothetical protein